MKNNEAQQSSQLPKNLHFLLCENLFVNQRPKSEIWARKKRVTFEIQIWDGFGKGIDLGK